LLRPSTAKDAAVREASKLEREEHRLLLRLTKENYIALRVAASQRAISIKRLVLTLAADAGIAVDPDDGRGDKGAGE
jgi:hypothetical protein